MAPFRNLFNEESPDQMRVRVFVRTKDFNGRLLRVEAENSKQEMSEISLSSIGFGVATAGAQAINFISPNVSDTALDVTTAIAVNRIPHKVLLLDVGRWGGPRKFGPRQRNFGVVWGTFAALCEFEPSTAGLDTDANLVADDQGRPLPDNGVNDLLRELRKGGGGSVRLLRAMRSDNPNYLKGWKQDLGTVWVILPDLHLPIATASPDVARGDGHHMGRHQYKRNLLGPSDDNGMIKGQLAQGALDWFKKYFEGDIFGRPDESAATDLIRFLDQLEKATLRAGLTLHVVQIGDMYDLWIGLERFFSQQKDHLVELANRDGILAGTFIDHWVARTREAFQTPGGPNLVDRLNLLATRPGLKTSWLWGNHDNYLARHTPVVPAGHPAVPARKRDVVEGGIRIEHGQRGDPSNRDGEASGHKTTNDVFDSPILRKFDPNRRNFYTALAAVTYVASPSFHIFVMGHTHSPFLTRVQIETVLTT